MEAGKEQKEELKYDPVRFGLPAGIHHRRDPADDPGNPRHGSIYPPNEIRMKPGDSIFVYTDGVPEASNQEHAQFGIERMIHALNTEPDAAPEKTLSNMRWAVDDFVKNAEQFDDLTMLCLKYNGDKP